MEQFEALEAQADAEGKRATRDWILRRAGKLSPERPRPPERAQNEAVAELLEVRESLIALERRLRETGSDEELALLAHSRRHVARTLCILASTSRRGPFEANEFAALAKERR